MTLLRNVRHGVPRVMSAERMRLVGHDARIWKNINSCWIFWGEIFIGKFRFPANKVAIKFLSCERILLRVITVFIDSRDTFMCWL